MVRKNSQYHIFIFKITDDISIIQTAEECANQLKSLYDPAYNLKPSDGRGLNRHLLNHERINKQLKDILEDVKNTTIHCLKGVPSLKLTHFSIPLIQIRFHLSKMKLQRLSKASIASRQHKRIPRFFSRGFAASKFQKNENRKRAARMRKKRRLDSNLMRVFNICVKSPIDNENNQPKPLVYPPTIFILIPEQCINVEGIVRLQLLDAECVAALLQTEPCQFSNAAASGMDRGATL